MASLDTMRTNINFELSLVQFKSRTDGLHFGLRRGRLGLVRRPITCCQKFFEALKRLLFRSDQRLQNKVVKITNLVEDYINRETDKKKLNTFLNKYTLSINELYQYLGKKKSVKFMQDLRYKNDVTNKILLMILNANNKYEFYRPEGNRLSFRNRTEIPVIVNYSKLSKNGSPVGKIESLGTVLEYDPLKSFSLSTFERAQISAEANFETEHDLTPGSTYEVTIFPTHIKVAEIAKSVLLTFVWNNTTNFKAEVFNPMNGQSLSVEANSQRQDIFATNQRCLGKFKVSFKFTKNFTPRLKLAEYAFTLSSEGKITLKSLPKKVLETVFSIHPCPNIDPNKPAEIIRFPYVDGKSKVKIEQLPSNFDKNIDIVVSNDSKNYITARLVFGNSFFFNPIFLVRGESFSATVQDLVKLENNPNRLRKLEKELSRRMWTSTIVVREYQPVL